MSFVFAKTQPAGNHIVVTFPFGKWPSKCLIGINERELREIRRRMPLEGPLTEQLVFDVLRGNGKKQAWQ